MDRPFARVAAVGLSLLGAAMAPSIASAAPAVVAQTSETGGAIDGTYSSLEAFGDVVTWNERRADERTRIAVYAGGKVRRTRWSRADQLGSAIPTVDRRGRRHVRVALTTVCGATKCKDRSTIVSATTLKPVDERWAGSTGLPAGLRAPRVASRTEPMPTAGGTKTEATRCRYPVRNAPALLTAPPIDDCDIYEHELVGSTLLVSFFRPTEVPDYLEDEGRYGYGVQYRTAVIDLAGPAPAWTMLGSFTTGPGTESGIRDACLLPGRVVTLTGEADETAGPQNGRETFRLTATTIGASPATSWQVAVPELGPLPASKESTGNARASLGRPISIVCTSTEVFASTSIPGKGEREIEQILRYTPTAREPAG